MSWKSFWRRDEPEPTPTGSRAPAEAEELLEVRGLQEPAGTWPEPPPGYGPANAVDAVPESAVAPEPGAADPSEEDAPAEPSRTDDGWSFFDRPADIEPRSIGRHRPEIARRTAAPDGVEEPSSGTVQTPLTHLSGPSDLAIDPVVQQDDRAPGAAGDEAAGGTGGYEREAEGRASDHHDEPVRPTSVPKEKLSMALDSIIQQLLSIEGATGAAVIDSESGMALAQGGSPGFDLGVAAAGNSNVVRAKMATMREIGLDGRIDDILLTLDSQYHLINVLDTPATKGLFVYLVLDRSRANLALARHRLRALAPTVEV